MARFKEEHGEDALKHSKKKKKEKKNKSKKEAKASKGGGKDSATAPASDGGAKGKKAKKEGSKGGDDNGKKGAARQSLFNIDAVPAKGLPEGWTTRDVPRKNKPGAHDRYWFSPALQHKFRSKAEVDRFRSKLKDAGGDESRAWELYSKSEKDRSAASARKRKKSDADASVKDDGSEVPSAWDA